MTTADTLELIYNKAEDLRREQDSKLQRLLRLATSAPIVALSAGAVAVAVSDDLAATAAIVVFSTAITLGVILFTVEAFAAAWREGPGINELLGAFRDRRPARQGLQLSMIVILAADHTRNGRVLNRVKRLVVLQGLVALSGLTILLFQFRELA